MSVKISSGLHHRVPKDLRGVLESDKILLELWNGLTPLARNEWICWLTIYKQDETRQKHLKRLPKDLKQGHKRPCCWPGCPHQNPKTAKWFSKKQ